MHGGYEEGGDEDEFDFSAEQPDVAANEDAFDFGAELDVAANCAANDNDIFAEAEGDVDHEADEADEAENAENNDDSDAEPDFPAVGDYEIDLTKSLFISGPHHMVHNCTSGLMDVMVWWDTFIELLKHICRLLSNKFSKDRLIRSCYQYHHLLQFIQDIRKFNGKVYDERWGTAMACTHQLLQISYGLRQGWRRDRYLGGHGVLRVGDDACDVDVVERGIRSMRFWAYASMVDIIAVLFLFLSSWFDSCTCHEQVPGHGAWSTFARRSYWHRPDIRPQFLTPPLPQLSFSRFATITFFNNLTQTYINTNKAKGRRWT
jgi:hypothetical protein